MVSNCLAWLGSGKKYHRTNHQPPLFSYISPSFFLLFSTELNILTSMTEVIIDQTDIQLDGDVS